jgi:hypothetical protein
VLYDSLNDVQVLLLAIRLLGMRTTSLREQKTANYVNYSVRNGLQQLKHPFAMLSHLHKEQEGVDFVGIFFSFFLLKKKIEKKFHRLCHLFICPVMGLQYFVEFGVEGDGS